MEWCLDTNVALLHCPPWLWNPCHLQIVLLGWCAFPLCWSLPPTIGFTGLWRWAWGKSAFSQMTRRWDGWVYKQHSSYVYCVSSNAAPLTLQAYEFCIQLSLVQKAYQSGGVHAPFWAPLLLPSVALSAILSLWMLLKFSSLSLFFFISLLIFVVKPNTLS